MSESVTSLDVCLFVRPSTQTSCQQAARQMHEDTEEQEYDGQEPQTQRGRSCSLPTVGTTSIAYQDEESSKKKKGLLAIFHVQDGSNRSSSESLAVTVLNTATLVQGPLAWANSR